MDFDIPLPEELELLEANSHLDEDYLDLPPPGGDDSDFVFDGEPKSHQPRSPPCVNGQINGHKRPRLQTPEPPSTDADFCSPADEKRSKIDNQRPDINDDEDWLRYSPPRDVDPVVEVEIAEKVLSRYASEIEGECFPITAASSGERVYAKISRADGEERVKKLDLKGQSIGLIPEPVNVMLQKAEQEAFAKVLQATSEDLDHLISPETSIFHEQLWVDKYAPKSFTELLSEEQTNREALLWLKQWDPIVFGSEIRSTSDEVLSALRRHSGGSQQQKVPYSTLQRRIPGQRWSNGNSRFSKNSDDGNSKPKGMQDFRDKNPKPTGPPEQKILLLCGPPGLGKTTLAHVAANHCGYRVVEVNASDERSSSTVEAKILDVVQMNSVTADARPKCLVIDEIDGALGEGKGAVDVILKMVSAGKKQDNGKENVATHQNGRASSKKERKTASLSRPVICICNDLYAPALRPLRHVAKVHIFVQPTVSRVVNRLKYICNKEGMKTSSFALTALAEYTECDVRSCLNTLQFLNKKKENLSLMDIGSQVVGRKDMSRSVFDIWKEIFHKRKMKRERISSKSTKNMGNGFDFLNSLISNRGDYDLIFDGIHENILQLHYHDPVMQKTVKSLDCVGTSDMLHRYIMRTQQMPLYVYFPSLAISVHHEVAQDQKPNIEWPKSTQKCRTMLMERLETLRSWHFRVPPYIGRHLSTKTFVEDSISLILHILSPPNLKPVALHLLSDTDRNTLAQLVDTMVSYSITYRNVKLDPASISLGQEAASDPSALTFDPPIHDFVNFKGHTSSHHVIAMAMKKVLVHEVEKQKILLAGMGKNSQDNGMSSKENQALVAKKGDSAVSAKENYMLARAETMRGASPKFTPTRDTPSTSATSSIRKAETALSIKSTKDVKKPSRAFNFFDRFRKTSKASQQTTDTVQKAPTFERDLRPLLFKFNEGFTNAVKRPVRMRDLLL